MREIYRKAVAMLGVVFIGLSSFSTATAATNDSISKTKVSPEVTVARPTENLGVTVNFIDLKLSRQENNGISPMGEYREEYDHSYYVYDHSGISAYDVGPRSNDKFLISVARGSTKTLTQAVDISGTVSVSGSVEAKIVEVVKLGLTSNVSGTLKFTWTTARVFTGPDAPYNSRSYYGAINYDSYTCYVKRYDVYRKYNGVTYLGDTDYYIGLTTVNSVKVPKGVEYSVDSIQ